MLTSEKFSFITIEQMNNAEYFMNKIKDYLHRKKLYDRRKT
jgi:hypothetical protein